MRVTVKDVLRDKDGYYVPVTIKVRLPVVLRMKGTLNMLFDVKGYMRHDVGLSMLYRVLHSYWKKDDEIGNPLPETESATVDRFFEHWYQLQVFRSLGLEFYPIEIYTTPRRIKTIPEQEFEKNGN